MKKLLIVCGTLWAIGFSMTCCGGIPTTRLDAQSTNPGQAATISVGSTVTGAPGSPASVTNSGTSSAAVLNFTIPQGIQGPPGIQGIPGPSMMTLAYASNNEGTFVAGASVQVLQLVVPAGNTEFITVSTPVTGQATCQLTDYSDVLQNISMTGSGEIVIQTKAELPAGDILTLGCSSQNGAVVGPMVVISALQVTS